ncbi:hypothetical protein [Methylocystis rosea]|uniref:hypothetical protein n=1 Tax=Methylocystis rosea TaxID=173366 RepID=UPI000368C075|nr:hypothetical protein [Methylocystis rosea]
MPKIAKSPPAATGGARECIAVGANGPERSTSRLNLKGIPGRATLVRRWQGLKINRLTWRWVDDASGARGNDFGSLFAFINEGGVAQ